MSDELKPRFVSVKVAAEYLGGLNPVTVYALLDQQAIESRYFNKRRLVVVESLEQYADNLPKFRPSPETA